ncbi:hypothetical protein EB796_024655 [Bugula neritina]|uniref:Uncharacterized protein n=1 Tax=Bugula neritina TaxID=10212 RepID=A0A7J7IUF3_BUGNE|nr:hypothetical protein EB796_024655 [Bugula neritina]
MLESEEILAEVSMIKEYEYNQWARTKPLNPRDYENSKPIHSDKLESKCLQPSWYTTKQNNSLTALGTKNPLFSYEDLIRKFSQPKFLKRMGFIDSERDFNPIQVTLPDEEDVKNSQVAECARLEVDQTITPAVSNEEADLELLPPENNYDKTELSHPEPGDGEASESEELLSDDEEYQTEPDILINIPPERIPSSKRSNRQKLSLYKDDNMISSSKTALVEINLNQSVEKDISSKNLVVAKDSDRFKMPLPTVKLTDSLANQRKLGANLSSEQRYSKSKTFHAKTFRKETQKIDFPLKLHYADRKSVKFSQPICLCPKLSKETLNSLQAPTINKYYMKQNYGLNRCQLHNISRNSRSRDKIILKSL